MSENLPVGTRVRCTNKTRFAGKVGAVIGHSVNKGLHTIRWDDQIGLDDGGNWTLSSIEKIESIGNLQDQIEALTEKHSRDDDYMEELVDTLGIAEDIFQRNVEAFIERGDHQAAQIFMGYAALMRQPVLRRALEAD